MGFITQKPSWMRMLNRKIYLIDAIREHYDRIERLPRYFINEIGNDKNIDGFELCMIDGVCLVLIPFLKYLNANTIQPRDDLHIIKSGKYDQKYRRLTIPIDLLIEGNFIKSEKKDNNKKLILAHDIIRNVAEIWTIERFEIFKKTIKSYDILEWAKSIQINNEIPIPIVVPINNTWIAIIGYFKNNNIILLRYINVRDKDITTWCSNALPIILNTTSKNTEIYDTIAELNTKYMKNELLSRDINIFNLSKRIDDLENAMSKEKGIYEKIVGLLKNIK